MWDAEGKYAGTVPAPKSSKISEKVDTPSFPHSQPSTHVVNSIDAAFAKNAERAKVVKLPPVDIKVFNNELVKFKEKFNNEAKNQMQLESPYTQYRAEMQQHFDEFVELLEKTVTGGHPYNELSDTVKLEALNVFMYKAGPGLKANPDFGAYVGYSWIEAHGDIHATPKGEYVGEYLKPAARWVRNKNKKTGS